MSAAVLEYKPTAQKVMVLRVFTVHNSDDVT